MISRFAAVRNLFSFSFSFFSFGWGAGGGEGGLILSEFYGITRYYISRDD